MIKAVIFDLGDVIAFNKTREICEKYEKKFDLEKGILYDFNQAYYRLAHLGKISEIEEFWPLNKLKLGKFTLEAAKQMRQEIRDSIYLDWELVEYIKGLRSRFKIALVSNWDKKGHSVLERFGIVDLFDVIVFSSDVGLVKPDSKIFRLVLARLGVSASEALFIDNDESNIISAGSLGMQVLLYSSIEEVKKKLAPYVN